MPTYQVTAENTIFNSSSNSYAYIFSTGYLSTTDEITNNIDGIVTLDIDTIPQEVILIEDKDTNNNLQLYIKNYDYSNFLCKDNDTLSLACGRSYIAWSKNVPYTLTIPDCSEVDEDLVPKKYYCLNNECYHLSTNDTRTIGREGFDECPEGCVENPTETPS